MLTEAKLHKIKEKVEEKTGCQCKIVMLCKNSATDQEPYAALEVLHDYEGLYPSRDIWNVIRTIEQIVKRYKGAEMEHRGCYTATLVW